MSESILITGISSGVGHALAKLYLERGHEVYGISRRTPEDLADYGGLHFRTANLESLDDIEANIRELLKGVERLDCVVLNAGILGSLSDVQDIPLEDLKRIMDINLWSNKILIDTLLALEVKMPQVVAISSGAAVSAYRGWGGYSISKAGLNVLMKLYAGEVPNTHFVSMAPGLVDTRMQDYLCDEVDDERFDSLERLRTARNTSDMPTPGALAPIMVKAFSEARSLETGSYVDIRTMDAYQLPRDTTSN